MNYEKTVFIPFHLGDPAGILFFGHVITLAHETYESFIMERLDFKWSEWFQNTDWVVPIKEVRGDFKHPLFVGNNCLIKAQLQNLTESSFSMQYEFIQNKTFCCTVNTVHVFCSKMTGKKQPIPNVFHLSIQAKT
jgi:acyl-CoA thioesterase FadM